MIFGTVGTHTAPFDRLVRCLDEFAATTAERILIQIGTSTHEPRFADWFRMTDSDSFAHCLRDARLVVTPPADSLLEAIRLGKPVVAVPRQQPFGEVIDNHQVELGRELAQLLNLRVVEDIVGLAAALQLAPEPISLPRSRLGNQLIEALRRSIDTLAGGH